MPPFSFSRKLSCQSVWLCNGVVCVVGCGWIDVRTGGEAVSRGAVQGWSEAWSWGVGGVLGLLMGLLGGLRGLLVEPLSIGRSMA